MSASSPRLPRIIEGLPWRLTAFSVLPLFVASVVAAWLLLDVLEGAFERHLQSEIKMVGRALRMPVSDALEQGRFDRLERSLESASSIGRVYGVSVYDRDGELVATMGGPTTADSSQLSRILEQGERTGEYAQSAGRDVYSYFVPLSTHGEQVSGLLQITRRHRDIQELVEQLRAWALLILAASAVVMAAGVLGGHYVAVGRALQRLRTSIGRVEAGERGHRAETLGVQEVASVAGSLNAMLDSIDAAEFKVERERESRARLERRLQRTERLAAIGRLAGGVAHELGAPLTLVDGHAQRGLRNPQLPSAARTELETIRHEVGRMSRIVRQLLDYGRGGDERTGVPIRATRLVTICTTAVAPATTQGARLVVIPGDDEAVVAGVDTRVEQALINIVRNALEAAHSRVEIGWTAGENDVVFWIDDDGPGIESTLGDEIFEPFVTTKATQGGTGLGLAIAHAAVSERGGAIDFERSALGGARFIVSLPRHRVEAGT